MISFVEPATLLKPHSSIVGERGKRKTDIHFRCKQLNLKVHASCADETADGGRTRLIRELLNAMAPTGAAIREAVFMKKL
jgi:hypothetical protein